MKKVLKFSLRFVAVILILILLIGGTCFLFPEATQEAVYNTFYPKVRNTEKFAGEIRVETPEVYELMWIACSLTDAFQRDSNLLNYREEFKYYREAVASHFGPYKDHPLVEALNVNFSDGNYGLTHHAIRFLALNYELDENGKLQSTRDYTVSPILTKAFKNRLFLIPENKRLINDFIQQTNFKAFYQQHQAFYQKLADNYNQLADFKDMWNWLETKYPNRIQSYRIIFSPLTGGFHNTMGFDGKEDGFHQALMFVNAPPVNLVDVSPERLQILKGGYGRIVFTEIDHNYVNSLAARYPEALLAAMPELAHWNDQSQGYGSRLNTFQEYMTWGMYSIYLLEQYSDEDFSNFLTKMEEMMADYRGFIRFPEFNQELIRQYQSITDKEDMPVLYEGILKWMEQQSSLSEKSAQSR